MNYPVIIPTLNRYEHLKRCVESLANNEGANQTELVIGLDYPPSEKYTDGYKKIRQYLPTITGFSKVTILYAKENLGPVGNTNVLRDYVISQGYDAYIGTEDDNEFSPCFLEYMNQNLKKYKDDDSVFRVCGYLPFSYKLRTEYSQFVADRHIAWGIGCWVKKEKDFELLRNPEGLRCLYKTKSIQKYFETDRSESILIALVRMSKRKGGTLGDTITAAYMVYKNNRCVLPTKSMVRNHGWDGSGLHGGYVYGYKEQEIQTQSQYVMNEAPVSFTKDFEEKMHASRRNKKRDINEIQNAISWYMYKYLGIYCEFTTLRKMAKRIKKQNKGDFY